MREFQTTIHHDLYHGSIMPLILQLRAKWVVKVAFQKWVVKGKVDHTSKWLEAMKIKCIQNFNSSAALCSRKLNRNRMHRVLETQTVISARKRHLCHVKKNICQFSYRQIDNAI